MSGQLALALRSDAVKDLEARLVLFRTQMDRDDWLHPGRPVRLTVPWDTAGAGAGEAIPGVRCLRCGEPIFRFERTINHDLGWCGCPRDRATGHEGFESIEAMAADRAEVRAFPPCARCGHAWGLHTQCDVHCPPGIEDCDGYCYAWCGCRRYVPPAGAVTPWGTCPGCWADPRRCACAETSERGS